MIEEVKALLDQHAFSKVAIIDDAYDDVPTPTDLPDDAWTRFFDDVQDTEEELLRHAFGDVEYDALEQSQLRRDQKFVAIAWDNRNKLGAPGAELFGAYEQDLASKRSELAPLEELLSSTLKLSCQKIGRRGDISRLDAQIIFLDLFLGTTGVESALDESINRIRQVVDRRREHPPIVVLMSASNRLQSLAPTVRDRAELLGCQFRTLKKAELASVTTPIEKLYDLVVRYPDSERLNLFVLAWDKALTAARRDFLRAIRTLDLADYANMQALILDAEGQQVGDYVIDLYDLYLHNVLEGNGDLIQAARTLNEIKWDEYPPAQFMPSSEVTAIMDGALFHNEQRTKIESDIGSNPKSLRFGDVLLSPTSPVSAVVEGNVDAGAAAAAPRLAYMVMSQACDLMRGESDRVLLLQGRAQPYEWRQHDSSKSSRPTRTPIMIANGERFALEWDLLAPETWRLADIPSRVTRDGISLARRFRTPFALQLQELFLQRVGRVGTIAALPARYATSVRVFLRSADRKATLIAQASAEEENAVCLVGRDAKNQWMEWLLLSDQFCNTLADALIAAKADPPRDERDAFLTAVDNPAFYRALRTGLKISREKDTRPLQESGYDLVLVSTKQKWDQGQDVPSGKPIFVEVTIS